MKAQKKPIVIDYFDSKSVVGNPIYELTNWVKSFGDNFNEKFLTEDNGYNIMLQVKTLEGISYNISEDDIIIRGVKGEYYPCKKDIFDQTYIKL